MKSIISFLFFIFWINFSFSQLKDTLYGNVKSVREELTFLDKDRQNYRLFSVDGDYGHSGFSSNVYTKSRFYNNWYHSSFVHYLNYYKEFNEKGKATIEYWFYKNGDTVRSYNYKYNEKDKLIQVKEIFDSDYFKVTNYSYNRYDGNLISELVYYSDTPEVYRYDYYVYDKESKNLIEANNFNYEGHVGGLKFVYDEFGRKKKKISQDYWVYESHNDGSSSVFLGNVKRDKIKEEYFYDEKGNLQETWLYKNKPKDENQVELGSKKKYYYSNKGLLEYSIVTTAHDTLTSLIEYRYDNRGRKTEEIYINRKFIKDKSDILFDKKDIKINSIKFPKNNLIIQRKLSYKYDKNNLIELKETDTFGDIVTTTCKFEYVFDEKNNWIEQVKYINGEKLYVWKRKIVYW